MELNKVFLVGNLTRDPEVKQIPSGMSVCDFTLATNRKFKAKDGTTKEEVAFILVQAWGKTAEICGEYLKKGRPVLIEGRLAQDTWEDKDSGQKRSKTKIVADSVKFFPRSGNNDPDNGIPEKKEPIQDDLPF